MKRTIKSIALWLFIGAAIGCLPLAVIGTLSGQAPSMIPPKLFTYYMMPGGTAWTWKSVAIDAPLQLSVDPAGQAHIGAATDVCQRDTYKGLIKSSYTLKGPLDLSVPVSLYVNGLLEFPDYYTVSGTTLAPNQGLVDMGGTAEIVIRYCTTR